jgi:hypothetical protein
MRTLNTPPTRKIKILILEILDKCDTISKIVTYLNLYIYISYTFFDILKLQLLDVGLHGVSWVGKALCDLVCVLLYVYCTSAEYALMASEYFERRNIKNG